MSLRESFTEALKAAMKAGDAARTSSLRMILARLKETDIAARPNGPVADPEIQAMLRGMIKPRQEAASLYHQGKRPELAAKEEAEIKVIEEFLPTALEGEALAAAIDAAIAESSAAGLKDMGKVMAALKAAHGASIDLGRAGPLVKARLAP